MIQTDFLVIGGGIAGLSYALKVAEHGKVIVLFKKGLEESSTSWAQGGIAAVAKSDDALELHYQDTLVAGAGLCDENIVKLVVSEGPKRVLELIKWGVNFDKVSETEFHLHQEAGHSKRRIYHLADHTGHEIQQVLLRQAKSNPNILFLENSFAIDLITTNKLGSTGRSKVMGAYVLRNNKNVEIIAAKKILLATGGAGKVYLYTSNPDIATGDGVAIGFRAGCRVNNLEFFQFHPTCFYHSKAKNFLISEALRGEGAKLTRIHGELFMKKYHQDAELAPRDIVARAIDHEIKTHGEDHVLLDIRFKGEGFIKEHFPHIHNTCLKYGVDITKEPIPVVPAAHYCCGGVVTDQEGRTDIESLYAAGEVACTGLHGANRLASNSLLEGLVFGSRAAEHAIETFKDVKQDVAIKNIAPWDSGKAIDSDEQVVISQTWDEIRRYMWNYVGIVRSNKRLKRALNRSDFLKQEIKEYYWNFLVSNDLLELRNLSQVAELIIKAAMARKVNVGLHYNIDNN